MENDDKNTGKSREAFDQAGALTPKTKGPIDGRHFRDIPLPSRVQNHRPEIRDIPSPSDRKLT